MLFFIVFFFSRDFILICFLKENEIFYFTAINPKRTLHRITTLTNYRLNQFIEVIPQTLQFLLALILYMYNCTCMCILLCLLHLFWLVSISMFLRFSFTEFIYVIELKTISLFFDTKNPENVVCVHQIRSSSFSSFFLLLGEPFE